MVHCGGATVLVLLDWFVFVYPSLDYLVLIFHDVEYGSEWYYVDVNRSEATA